MLDLTLGWRGATCQVCEVVLYIIEKVESVLYVNIYATKDLMWISRLKSWEVKEKLVMLWIILGSW